MFHFQTRVQNSLSWFACRTTQTNFLCQGVTTTMTNTSKQTLQPSLFLTGADTCVFPKMIRVSDITTKAPIASEPVIQRIACGSNFAILVTYKNEAFFYENTNKTMGSARQIMMDKKIMFADAGSSQAVLITGMKNYILHFAR